VSTHRVAFSLNGVATTVTVTPERLLADVLRDDIGATGTKIGCGIGVCGACSVLVDGDLVSSCLLPAVLVDGRAVTTIEGIADGEMSPLQDAFIRDGGFQCGICTPGQIVAATALLAEHPTPSRDEVRVWMMGNLCRCTGYYGIERAIRRVASPA
jgi:aerobic-type carbon monoxide dehydrogenase small subunit (CoxS/CutS family)